MKVIKILTVLFVVLIACNTEVKFVPPVADAQTNMSPSDWTDYYLGGMHYKLRYCTITTYGENASGYPSSTDAASVAVINVTKDSLECEQIKHDLSYGK